MDDILTDVNESWQADDAGRSNGMQQYVLLPSGYVDSQTCVLGSKAAMIICEVNSTNIFQQLSHQ